MTKPTVFVLDDSELILEMAKEALLAHGYDVLTAVNLAQFEANAAMRRADLVVLDVNMPEVFGDDVATVLRGVRQWTVPILLFSSMDEAELERRAKEAGAEAWISKRAGVDAMVGRVAALLASQSTAS
jgi:DNA-binding response OmpR family regulator